VKLAYFEVAHSADGGDGRVPMDGAVDGLAWRAEGIDPLPGEPTATDLSVWEGPAGLQAFARSRTSHPDVPSRVAWWVGSRQTPTPAEGRQRLRFLRAHGSSPYAFAPEQPFGKLTINRVWLDDVDVQLLISQLNSDLYSRYPEPGALIFRLDGGDIVDGVGALLMATYDGEPVGCGAFRVMHDQPDAVEIKRMYVTLAGRGKKIGAAILVELEARARELGIYRFMLETGPRQPEALHRYAQAGYIHCSPWGEFVGKDLSVCMEKIDQQP
jgi:putative acetyltransferase